MGCERHASKRKEAQLSPSRGCGCFVGGGGVGGEWGGGGVLGGGGEGEIHRRQLSDRKKGRDMKTVQVAGQPQSF